MIQQIKLPEIVQLGNPVLRQSAETVCDVQSCRIRAVVDSMLCYLQQSNGVGLAAPQLGESFRLLVIASKPTKRYPHAPQMEPLVMFNPKFESLTASTQEDWEGCLSIPGIRARVSRFEQIRVNYVDESGRDQQRDMRDFIARVFQHEHDHLEGKVYLDRLTDNSSIVTDQEYQKLIQQTILPD